MAASPPPLPYASQTDKPPPPSRLREAVLFALFPLITGLSIFMAILVTRIEWLIAAGIFAVLFGAICVFAGTKALVRYVHDERAIHGRVDAGTRWRVAGAALLLLANYLAAFVCVEVTSRIYHGGW